MDIFQIVLFIFIMFGIFLVVKSLLIFKRESRNSFSNSFETSNAIKFFESSIEEIDKTMEKFNQTSSYIFSELEEKYQELLFLYSLVDEKKQEVTKNYKNKKIEPRTNILEDAKRLQLAPKQENLSQKPTEKFMSEDNINSKQILEMEKEGLSIPEMAKKLNIGQGEVKLILELGKNR